MRILLLLLLLAAAAGAQTFYDDFEDNDISDWEERGNSALWSVSNGLVHGYTEIYACELVPMEFEPLTDVEVQVYGRGVHNFGVCARYDDNDTGIVAYVSPDYDVARIRYVGNGTPGTILNSLYAAFPSGVWYTLTLTCAGNNLELHIEAEGESWQLAAFDPDPSPGVIGLHMAEEPSADWDWFSGTELTSTSPEGGLAVTTSLKATPNPFWDIVTLEIETPEAYGSVYLMDISGRMVARLPFQTQDGLAVVSWSASSAGEQIPAGVYLASIEGNDSPDLRLVRIR